MSGSTQELPQRSSPTPHDETHAPFTHVWFAPHATPHPPQFAASASVFVQAPAQRTVGGGQPQPPPLHVCPGPHTTPHVPQLFGLLITSVHAPLQNTSLG